MDNQINGVGKLLPLDKFDATFFSVHPKLASVMDPLTRLGLERSVEAIVDAGLNPSDLNGMNTPVFMSSSISESEVLCTSELCNNEFLMLAYSRAMQANRISYILNLTGTFFIFLLNKREVFPF